MKRKLPLFVMVGVAGVLVPVLAVLAQSSSTSRAPTCCYPAPSSASKPSAPSSTDSKIIDELIVILKETKSEETFVVTAMALGRMGPDAKRALPQLIRNAERLELFEDLFDPEAAKGDREVSQGVAEAIMMLAEGNKEGRPAGYAYPASPAPYWNGTYGPPVASSTWNQPAVVPSTDPLCPAGPAAYPATSAPIVPGTVSTPVSVPTMSTPAPTPLPAAKKPSTKSGKYPTPVPATRVPSP